MTPVIPSERNHWKGQRNLALGMGVIAVTVCAVGAFFDSDQFFRAYLFGYVVMLGMALGGMALVMIHHLTGGAWGLLVRRFAEAQMQTLPLVAVMFLPVAFGLPHIYRWASPENAAIGSHVGVKPWYLDPTFFFSRAAAYFAVWIVLAWLLRAGSRRFDQTGDIAMAWKLSKLSGPGLVILGISLHFAAMDWIMSLQPEFTSTIFGPLVFSSQLLMAYSIAVVCFCCVASQTEFESVLSRKAMNDLGGLLLTLLILWAYLAWFQYMLIWIADLPRDNVYFLRRAGPGWNSLVIIMFAVGLLIPFFLLLLRAVKQSPRLLAKVAGAVFVGQLMFNYYQVMPAFDVAGLGRHWMDLLMPVGLGGIWLASYAWLLSRRPLAPLHDLSYLHAVQLRELELEEIEREEALSHG